MRVEVMVGDTRAPEVLSGASGASGGVALTALGLDADLGHLAGNLAFGGVLGLFPSQLLGNGLTWLAIVLAGAVFNTLLHPAGHSAVGASTAISAALGLLAALALRCRASLRRRRGLRRWPSLSADAMAAADGQAVGFGTVAGGDGDVSFRHATADIVPAQAGIRRRRGEGLPALSAYVLMGGRMKGLQIHSAGSMEDSRFTAIEAPGPQARLMPLPADLFTPELLIPLSADGPKPR